VARFSGETTFRRVRRTIAVDRPAVGLDWTTTVPAGHVWELATVFASLTSSAVVANRVPRLVVTAEGVTILDAPPAAVQAASLTRRYSWAGYEAAYQVDTGVAVPLPPLVLAEGATVGSLTTALDVGDQWSAPVLYVVDSWVRGGAIDLGSLPDLRVEVVSAPSE
jgi:hypothetical protein